MIRHFNWSTGRDWFHELFINNSRFMVSIKVRRYR